MSYHHGRSDCPDIPITDQQFSVHVSRTLDCLGKSRDMVKFRVKMNTENMRLTSILCSQNWIIAGSKAEGLTSKYESDHDHMLVLPHIVCADNAEHFRETHAVVFQTERHDTPAGYTKLKLTQCYSDIPWLQDCLFHDGCGNRYWSSDFFMTHKHIKLKEDEDMKCLERSGPSLPVAISKKGDAHLDIVHAFCCVCPDILRAFIARPRLYNRPNRTLLNAISKLEGHVVPVGCKESETSYQEWRICFTKAELSLINSFKDIETKLYILLKMVSKIVKTVSTVITSYVMKNVVLWFIELYPVGMFTEELLTTRLIQALVFLKKCVEANFLPSYMIPERNLLPQTFDSLQKQKLTTFLNKLIQEGGYLLMRCEKIRVAMFIMYREPDMAEHFRLRRDLVDKVCLFRDIMPLQKQITTGLSIEQVNQLFLTDEIYVKIQRVSMYCSIPEWRVFIMLGFSLEYVCELWFERELLLLS